MKSWQLSTRLWTLVGLSWLVALATSSFLIYRLQSTSANYDRLFAKEMREQKLVRTLQVGFKKQVQAWKDILLRGHDTEALQKYTSELHQQEEVVRRLTDELIELVEDSSIRTLLDGFREANGRLASDYEAGRAAFAAAKGQNQRNVDAMVKGRDRPPTDLIDRIAESMSQRTSDQANGERSVIVSVAIAAALAFAGLIVISVFVVKGVMDTLRNAVVVAQNASKEVSAASHEIARASQSLAQGATEQAASIEETSAASQHIQSLATRHASESESAAGLVIQAQKGSPTPAHRSAKWWTPSAEFASRRRRCRRSFT